MSDKPNTQLAVAMPPAMLAVATLSGLAPEYIIQTVKAQCFKGAATDAQVDAFISIAMEMKVNPLLPGMLYAYPISGGGIVPIMGPSGVYKKLAEHPEVDSWETKVFPEDVTQPPTHAVTKIYRKGRDRPMEYTALLAEWKIDSNPNWRTRPRHMLALRSLKHCANQIIHGIPYDEDDRVIMDAINLTPEFRPASDATKGAAGAVNAVRNVTPVADPLPEGAAPVDVTPPAEERAPARQRRGQVVKPDEAKPAENPAPAATEQPAAKPAPEKVAEPLPPGAAPVPDKPRVFLQDGERVTVEVEVMDIITGNSKVGKELIPTVQAEVRGGFNGNVRHSGGASVNAAGVAVENPPWAKGAKVRLELFGKKSTSTTGPNVGKVLNWVSKIEAIEGAQGQIPVEEA